MLNNIKRLFHKHKHDFQISEYSNVIQYDDMGYPLRLCIEKCYCGKSIQSWIDINASSIRKTDVECKWTKACVRPAIPMSQCASIQVNENDSKKESN